MSPPNRIGAATAALLLALGVLVATAPAGHATARSVGTLAELNTALAAAQPGDVITMSDGVYNGRLKITQSGTAQAPITLKGSRDAVVDGGTTSTGRAVELTGDHWRLEGFTIRNGQKGLMALGVTGTVVDHLSVHTIGHEGIHFQHNSTDNTVLLSEVHDVGKTNADFGEAIYFGSAINNWPGGVPDRSDRNKAVGNTLGPNVTAEHIDIKEGTTGGEVRANVFDGRGQTGANSGESWINAKGNDYLIRYNTGTGAYRHGYKTRKLAPGWGCGNVFQANKGSVAPYTMADGYAFSVTNNSDCASDQQNVVCDDNTVTGGGKGVSTIAVTPCAPRACS